MIHEREMEYDWHCSEGAIDVHVKLRLELRIAAEQGLFSVQDVTDAIVLGLKCTSKTKSRPCFDNETFCWFLERFWEHYEAGTHNLDDDIETEACAKIGPKLVHSDV